MEKPLGFQVKMGGGYDETIELVTAELKKEGFGVLTRIDVRATLKEKIDAEFRPYTILGACNPGFALRALSSDPQVGLLLPCNVTVDERQDGVWVSIADPKEIMGVETLRDNEDIQVMANEARNHLQRVAAALAG